ncbi:hypothetical protein AVEN_189646-1 [Araneus ventricosus]|uniref:Uncharacterized protein n=1 Tax=Araneus ventricosus TaxID=182803 RepID=A0A4Y2I5M7_ARAVE|nr:hypothetical protein AVEN_189646-1 [Araneus ventricosus]
MHVNSSGLLLIELIAPNRTTRLRGSAPESKKNVLKLIQIKIRNLTLEEALLLFDELNSDLDLEDTYIEPPDIAVVSDEDSEEEDEEGLTDNLSRCQLCVNVEISRKKTTEKII